MRWTKEETGRSGNPYYYKTEYKSLTLTLSLPYKSDPWSVKLTGSNGTITKEVFRFRSNERSEDETLWESVEDLEKAKATAFQIMEDYINEWIMYWSRLQIELITMKNLK